MELSKTQVNRIVGYAIDSRKILALPVMHRRAKRAVSVSQLSVEYEAMADRHELYAKYGIAAEAAQLFETELSTMLLCLRALQNGWHIVPDSERASAVLSEIDKKTMGGLIRDLKPYIDLDEAIEARFAAALDARNRLIHGFFERHNFKIRTSAGRDEMAGDLEQLHEQLFHAWQTASGITTIIGELIGNPRPVIRSWFGDGDSS